jgi:hypothetical protein
MFNRKVALLFPNYPVLAPPLAAFTTKLVIRDTSNATTPQNGYTVFPPNQRCF